MFLTSLRRVHRLTVVSAVVASVAGLGIVAVYAWGDAAPQDEIGPPTTYTTRTAPVATTHDPDAVVASVWAALGRQFIEGMDLAAPPADSGDGASWLYTTVTAQSDDPKDYLPGVWEADLAQGAIAEQLPGDNDLRDVVSGSEVTVALPNGHEFDVPGGAGDVQRGQAFTGGGMSDAALGASVSAAIAGFGLKATSVRILRPLGPAVHVVASTSDPATLSGRLDDIIAAIAGTPIAVDGVYLEVDTANGDEVLNEATAYRSGSGHVIVAPAYADVVDDNHGGTPEAPPSPYRHTDR